MCNVLEQPTVEIQNTNASEIQESSVKVQEQLVKEMTEEQLQQAEITHLQRKINQYDPLIQKAFELLLDINKHSLMRVLEYCNISKDTKPIVIKDMPTWFESTNSGEKMWITVSKGNLRVGQKSWFQLTGPISSNNRIFKDANTFNHSIMLALGVSVPLSVLRTLHLNVKKVQPIIHSLYGYEPYNLLDMSKEEYQKEKLLTDIKAIEYSEKYKQHIDFLVNKSPYQAANCILALQGRINLKIQSTIQDVLANGNPLTMDSVVIHSFEPLAEATRELIARYHVENATDDDRLKIKKFLALYFARIEEVNTKTNDYVQSMRTKYHLDGEVPVSA